MDAIFYLYGRTTINKIKTALRKPVTYFYILFLGCYLVGVPMSLKMVLEEGEMATPGALVSVMTLFTFFVLPMNLLTYAKRKGLMYRKCDVHFLFPSPITPKMNLLYAYFRTLIMTIGLNLFIVICGIFIFHVQWWKMLLYFLLSIILENCLEACIMIFIYGNEFMDQKGRKVLQAAVYAILAVLVVIALYDYHRYGLGMEFVSVFLHSPAVQMVPVIGWYIAVIHLIFTAPTVVSIIGSILYLLFCVIMFIVALRMPCVGGYYEDAMSFADDYEEALDKAKKGSGVANIGKKQKYGQAKVVYKGRGAKAIFYRQLLEYKKNRFFILDGTTIAALVLGSLAAYIYGMDQELSETFKNFLMIGVSAYMVLMFSSMSGKWGKEIASPYTYLIPANNFSKLWYATLMQHMQAILNGTILLLPVAIVLKLSPITTVLGILFYVILNANKLYALAVAEIVVGQTFGKFGQQMFQLFIQGGGVALAVVLGVLIYRTFDINVTYLMINIILALVTLIFMVIAALNFQRMEKA